MYCEGVGSGPRDVRAPGKRYVEQLARRLALPNSTLEELDPPPNLPLQARGRGVSENFLGKFSSMLH